MEATHAIQRRCNWDSVSSISKTISESLRLLSIRSVELLIKQSQNTASCECTDSKIALSLATYYFVKHLNEELHKSGKQGDTLLEYNLAAAIFRFQGFEQCSAGKFDFGQGLSGDPRFLAEHFVDMQDNDPAKAIETQNTLLRHGITYMRIKVEADLVPRKRE